MLTVSRVRALTLLTGAADLSTETAGQPRPGRRRRAEQGKNSGRSEWSLRESAVHEGRASGGGSRATEGVRLPTGGPHPSGGAPHGHRGGGPSTLLGARCH